MEVSAPPAPLLPPLGGKPPSRRKRSSNISRYQEAIRGRRMEMNCVLGFFFRFFILYLDCCVCRGGGAEGMWDPADPLTHPPPARCLPLFALLLSPPPPHESLIVLAAGDGGRERVKSLAPLGEKASPVSFALTVQQCGSNHASTSL